MESPAKRRKLDATGGGRIPSTTRPKPPISAAPRAPPSQKPNTNGIQPTAGHAAWQEAKALSQARKGKKLEINSRQDGSRGVYYDFEGAHAHQSPFKVSSTSTPTKKYLDPLRNQQQAAGQTPTPVKSRVSLDFFKQFSSPKQVTEPKGVSKEAKPVNGAKGHAIQEKEEQVTHPARESEDLSEDEEEGQESSTHTSVKTNSKGWAYEKPKKTFEDEIRELEDVARQEADQEDDADASHRRSARKSKPSLHIASRDLAKRAKVAPREPVQALKIQKTKPSGQDHFDRTEGGADDGDGMEIDEIINDFGNHSQNSRDNESIQEFMATPTKNKSEPIHKLPRSLKDATFSGQHLHTIQNIVLEKLTGKRPVRLVNLEDEYAKVSSLVTQTIAAGESNSMLVIGSRGSGKTALVNRIFREQTAQHADDFHVVRLSGFVHTDDKVALREIWRQLGREMEDEDGASKNYADTMSRLLALLSHSVEQESEVTKSVIFILDEFELFAGHPRQTLLYNLFDIAQSRKAPIAVLGLTTRIDVAESFEKRVKSRFSHRYVHLSSAKSLNAFQDACKSALTIDPKDLSAEEREKFGPANQLAAKLEKVVKKDDKNILTHWNAFINDLLNHEQIGQHLRRIYYTTKSIPEFHGSLLISLATLPSTSNTTTQELLDHFTTSITTHPLRPSDSKLLLLQSLSTLHLALLISAARLTNIHSHDTVPFAQAYDEYKVLASKAKLQASASGALAQGAGSKVSGKEVAKGAWEDLVEMGLVMEDGGRGGRVDVGLEEIGGSGVELGRWGRWCREI